MKLYKIVDGALKETETTKIEIINGAAIRVNKTAEELNGYKELKVVYSNYPNVYENETITLNDTGEYIEKIHGVEDKTQEEIIKINSDFWNESYFKVLSLMPKELYAPYKSYLDGKEHDLLKDDYAVLLLGASAGQLTALDLYSKPDFTKKMTEEYLLTLKVSITDPIEMTNTLGYFGSLNFGARTVPTVIV